MTPADIESINGVLMACKKCAELRADQYPDETELTAAVTDRSMAVARWRAHGCPMVKVPERMFPLDVLKDVGLAYDSCMGCHRPVDNIPALLLVEIVGRDCGCPCGTSTSLRRGRSVEVPDREALLMAAERLEQDGWRDGEEAVASFLRELAGGE